MQIIPKGTMTKKGGEVGVGVAHLSLFKAY